MNIRKKLVKQFKKPTGMLGRLAGSIMANRKSNLQRNEWAVSFLQLNDGDRVLEIGCGPGLGIAKIAEIYPKVTIIANDHSELMLKSTKKRNNHLLVTDRLKFLLGNIEEITLEANSLDAVYSSNVVQFWNNPKKLYSNLYKALKTDGVIVTNYMDRSKNASSRGSYLFIEKIAKIIEDCGFKDYSIEKLDTKPVATYCLIMQKGKVNE